jgi:D-alanine--poly(phosphoribitol) ligase subunit 1
MHDNFNLVQPFYEHSVANSQSLALVAGDARLSYGELASLARRISGWLGLKHEEKSGRVGILANRTVEAFAGVLGTLWSGAAYVPINPHTPEDRLIRILKTSNLDALIAEQDGLDRLSDSVLEHAPSRILYGAGATPSQGALGYRQTSFTSMTELPDEGPDMPVPVAEDALAYIIFTSGTTGTPKGVMIETGSMVQLLEILKQKFGLRADDSVSHTSDLTFDASVFTMFMTWSAGAALYVVPERQLIAPGKFIRDNKLTVSFFVPSVAMFMQRIGMLKPGIFPRLRYSFFGGEGLPLASAKAWQAAAPNSAIENLYGPTEVTVLCTTQRLTDPPNVTPNRGVLAIGDPVEGIEVDVVDSEMNPVPWSEPGELILAGRQLARGYLNDPEMTASRFPVLKGKRWYRTGDLACRDAGGAFHCLGRIDNQVKILGNRVELEEVDAHLREIVGTDLAAAVAWPRVESRATGIVAFHCAAGVTREDVREGMKMRVPEYMIPQRVHFLNQLPLGSTGKIDRKALIRLLDEGQV